MPGKPHTTSGLVHRHALIASQLSVKYTSENILKKEWIAAILLVLPLPCRLKWPLRFCSDPQKLQIFQTSPYDNECVDSMYGCLVSYALPVFGFFKGGSFCQMASHMICKTSLLNSDRAEWILLMFLHRIEKYSVKLWLTMKNMNLSY